MENFILHLISNPLLYIKYFLTACAAIGAMLFIAGLTGGVSHIFTYKENASHMEHRRTRTVWGVYVLMVSWGVWEVVKVAISMAAPSHLFFALLLLTPLWVPWLKRSIFGGGEH